MCNGYNGWNKPLMVTLTATSNTYLADRLPLRGLACVHEMATDNYAQRGQVSFLELDEEGKPVGTEVMVDDAEFTYSLRPAPAAKQP